MVQATLSAVFVIGLVGSASADPIDRDQIQVVDGDTVHIDGKNVRLVGFDTPETTFGEYRCDPELEWGKRAAARLNEILDSANTIDIRYRKRPDRYKRPLALLKVDGRNVGQTLIRERLAVRYNGSGPKMDWCPRYRGR